MVVLDSLVEEKFINPSSGHVKCASLLLQSVRLYTIRQIEAMEESIVAEAETELQSLVFIPPKTAEIANELRGEEVALRKAATDRWKGVQRILSENRAQSGTSAEWQGDFHGWMAAIESVRLPEGHSDSKVLAKALNDVVSNPNKSAKTCKEMGELMGQAAAESWAADTVRGLGITSDVVMGLPELDNGVWYQEGDKAFGKDLEKLEVLAGSHHDIPQAEAKQLKTYGVMHRNAQRAKSQRERGKAQGWLNRLAELSFLTARRQDPERVTKQAKEIMGLEGKERAFPSLARTLGRLAPPKDLSSPKKVVDLTKRMGAVTRLLRGMAGSSRAR